MVKCLILSGLKEENLRTKYKQMIKTKKIDDERVSIATVYKVVN